MIGTAKSKGVMIFDTMSIVEKALSVAAKEGDCLLVLAPEHDRSLAAAHVRALHSALALIALIVRDARQRSERKRRRARKLAAAAVRPTLRQLRLGRRGLTRIHEDPSPAVARDIA